MTSLVYHGNVSLDVNQPLGMAWSNSRFDCCPDDPPILEPRLPTSVGIAALEGRLNADQVGKYSVSPRDVEVPSLSWSAGPSSQ